MAALATLVQDAFGSTLNTSLWTVFTVSGATESVATVSGRLRISHDIAFDYPGFPPPSTGAYSSAGEIASSNSYVRFYPPQADEPWKLNTCFGALNVTNLEGFGWHFQNGSLEAKIWNNINDEWQVDVGSLTYDSTNHAWLRVRHDTAGGGTFYWDTAPDSGSGTPGTWTNRFSALTTATGVAFDDMAGFLGTGGARVYFHANHWDNTITGAYIGPEFDGVNTALVAAGVTHATSGALAAGAARLAGSGARTRVHATNGTLAPSKASLVAAAARSHLHATTGVLAPAKATLAGTSARSGAIVNHGTSGALQPGAAVLAGAAAIRRTHGTSGALQAVPGALAGSGARTRVHAATAVLAPSKASLVAAAARAAGSNLIGNFTEDFEGALNPAKWAFSTTPDVGGTSNGTYDILDGRLRLFGLNTNPYDGDAFMESVNAYSLLGSSCRIRMSMNSFPERIEAGLRLFSATDPTSFVVIIPSETSFFCARCDAGSFTFVDTDQTYSAANHAWLQIRETGGTVYFEGAPDVAGSPGAFTVLASFPTANSPWSLANVKIRLHRRQLSVALPSTSDGMMLVDAVNTGAAHVAVNHATSGALRGAGARTIASSGHGGLAAIKDSFDGAVLDAAKWSTAVLQGTGSASQSDGKLKVAVTSGATGDRVLVTSIATGTLLNQSAFARLSQAIFSSANSFGAEATFDLVDGNNGIGWHQQSSGMLDIQRMVGGVVVETVAVSYTPFTHAWLRMREQAGQVYWETASADAHDPPLEGEWTIRYQKATADIGFSVTNLGVRFMTQVWDGSAGVPTTVPAWECVNTQTRSPQAHATSGALAARGGLLAAAAAKKVLHVTSGALRPGKAVLEASSARRHEHTTSGALAGGSAIITANSSTSDVTRKIWFDTQDTAGAWSEQPQPADPWTLKDDASGSWGP